MVEGALFEENMPAGIVYTSGTTGIRKGRNDMSTNCEYCGKVFENEPKFPLEGGGEICEACYISWKRENKSVKYDTQIDKRILEYQMDVNNLDRTTSVRKKKSKMFAVIVVVLAVILLVGVGVFIGFKLLDGSESIELNENTPEFSDYSKFGEERIVSIISEMDENTEELKDQVKAKTLDAAKALADYGDYVTAIVLLKSAQETQGDDIDYQAALKSYSAAFKMEVISSADNLAAKEDYISALEAVGTAATVIGDDKELSAKANEYENAYVVGIIEQADGLLLAGEFDSAETLVNAARKQFPQNEQLDEATKRIIAASVFDISQSTLYFSRVGDFTEITANVIGVQWSTNAPDIVSVSNSGCVTALNGGTAEVYAKYNDTVKVCSVTVDTRIPTETEIVEAKRQLQIVEDYESKYTTYSYSELQAMYYDFISAGNRVSLYSTASIKQFDNAKVTCYMSNWYYSLEVYYYDSSNVLVYRDDYTIVTNGSIDISNPTFADWVVSSVYNQLFSVSTDKARYYCYHDFEGGAFSWLLYETEYIDGIASRTIVIADYLP